MKKVIQTLLAGLLAVAPVAATTRSGKTFFGARDTLNYSPLFNAVSPMMEKGKDAFGADISANVFWKQSHNATAMGKYFGGGIDGDATKTVDGTIDVTTTAAAGSGTNALRSHHIDHDVAANITTNALGMTGSVTLKPEHRELGVTLAWTQCLDAVVEGMWVSARTAVVDVETNIKATVAAGETKSVTTLGLVGKGLLDFFDGSASNSAATGQIALAKQKMSAKALNETGIADVHVSLGYNFMKEDDTTVSGSFDVVVPTGNTAKGVHMFEPIIGKGGAHWAVGAGLNAAFNVWKSDDKKHAVNFVSDAAYKYYFDAKQTRTLGLTTASDSKAFPAGHYALATTVANTTKQLIPFANLGTVDMNITPGSHFELNAGFNGMHDSFCWDLGYNLGFKEEETAKLKKVWADGTTSIATDLFNTGTDAYGTRDEKIESASTVTGAVYAVDINAARTPSQLTHAVNGSLGWVFKDIKTPVRIGLGGFYEVSGEKNDALETWSLFGKVGINF